MVRHCTTLSLSRTAGVRESFDILGADDFLTGFEFFLHTGNDFEAFALAEFIGEFFFSAADYDIMAQCTGAALSDNTQIEFFRIDG